MRRWGHTRETAGGDVSRQGRTDIDSEGDNGQEQGIHRKKMERILRRSIHDEQLICVDHGASHRTGRFRATQIVPNRKGKTARKNSLTQGHKPHEDKGPSIPDLQVRRDESSILYVRVHQSWSPSPSSARGEKLSAHIQGKIRRAGKRGERRISVHKVDGSRSKVESKGVS